MRSMGISPGDAVFVIEHRGEQEIVYNGLVQSISMQEKLAGAQGEPAIEAAFVAQYTLGYPSQRHPVLSAVEVVHISHRDWIEKRAGLGYEELPASETEARANFLRTAGRAV